MLKPKNGRAKRAKLLFHSFSNMQICDVLVDVMFVLELLINERSAPTIPPAAIGLAWFASLG